MYFSKKYFNKTLITIKNPDSPYFIINSFDNIIIMNNFKKYYIPVIIFSNKDPIMYDDNIKINFFNIDLILFGCDSQSQNKFNNLLIKLCKQNIGFEITNHKSACRTFNFLLDQGKKVILILI